jgi:hypothetical protein
MFATAQLFDHTRTRLHQFNLLLPFLIIFSMLFTGCASVPKSFTDGSALYQGGNFESAATSFEQAAKEAPNEESIPLPLSESQYKTAEIAFKKAVSSNKLDLRKIIEHDRKAMVHADKSIAALRAALAKPNEGPGFMDRMKKMTDSTYKSLRERQELQNKESVKLKANINENLTATQAELDSVLAETSRLLGINRQTPAGAYDEFVKYFPYAPYITEVSVAKLEIEQLTIKQLEKNGLAQIDSMDYAGANLTFTRIETILGGKKYAAAGMHAITGHQAYQAKDYEAAFEKLLAIRSIHPDSAFLTAYFEKTQQLLIETKLAEVDVLITAGKLAGMIEAFEKLSKLTKAAQEKATFIAAIDERKKVLRTKVAADYIRRAAELKQLDELQYSSLILQNLRLARQFDPEQVAALEADAAKAHGVTARKGEIKVLVSYNGTTGTSLEWAKRLESDLFISLEKSGIPGLTLLDSLTLPGDTAHTPGVVDLLIKGNMDAVEFSESGRDTPRRRSSKYISGTRQVSNPNYAVNERAYRDAEASYRSSYSAMENLKAQCRRLDGFLAKSICEAGVTYVSTSSRDSALAKWQGTPKYLDQNIISSYQYDFYTVKVNGLVRGKCTVSDTLSRTEAKCTEINEKVKLEGTITTNAQATDTEGIKNVEVDVPDLVNEQETAYSKILATASTELLQQVAEQRAERYCKLGDTLKKPSDMLKSMEAYNLCAFISGSEQNKRRAELEEKLNGYFMVTPEQAKAFGAKENVADASWPAPAEVSDSDLKVVMARLAAHGEAAKSMPNSIALIPEK